MKKTLVFLLLIYLIGSILPAQDVIHVTKPDASCRWNKGFTYWIKWDCPYNPQLPDGLVELILITSMGRQSVPKRIKLSGYVK